MFKKVMSMVLSLSLVLSCAMISGAASVSQQSATEDGDIVYVYDNFTVVISDEPTIQSRDVTSDYKTGTATTDEPGEHKMSFSGSKYTSASITIENVDSSDALNYTISGTVSGEPVEIEVTNLKAGYSKNVKFTANSGTTLSGSVTTVVEPYKSTAAVDYEYTGSRTY